MNRSALAFAGVLLLVGSAVAADRSVQAKPSAAIPAQSAQPDYASPANQAVSTESEYAPVAMAQPRSLTGDGRVPTGTAIRIRMQTKVATGMTLEGSEFTAEVAQPVVIASQTVIPQGAMLSGTVARCSNPRRIAGRPTIDLHPETLTMPDGTKHRISAVVVDSDDRSLDVDDEGHIRGSGHSSRDVKEIGIGSAAGAIIGGLSAGAKGTFIGLGIGAGVTTAHWMTRHHEAAIQEGTELTLELSHPMPLN